MKKIKFSALHLFLFTCVLSFVVYPSYSQQKKLGDFDGQTDVGNPARKGSAVYNSQTGQYTMEGAGANVWAERDEFHFVWKRMKGNFILTTRAGFIGKGVEEHRKMGWMVRSSLDDNSMHVNAVVHGDGLTSLQYRNSTGGITEEQKSSIVGADVIQLERKGNHYIMSVARFGDTFTTEEMDGPALGDEVYVGLFVCSHNKDVSEKAILRDVRIVVPAPDKLVPYREYLGSNLETLDVKTGNRKIVYYSTHSLQAPNWTKDGQSLIYNSDGLLYRFNLAKRIPVVINTDFATNNNNDHVISFDGKMLAISHGSKTDGNNSIVYTVPITGGKPRRITATGPSYLHGWSPDGKFLVYVGSRNNDYDIYRASAMGGGEETRLTDTKGLDDGPEYSPDGKFIYFNSVRTGSMQIWRMNADGSGQEQLTDDDFYNWFPHISPDGQWVVFISFMKNEVKPDDHPFYKHVYLRLMPAGGGNPRVIAYLYGGQGTINTPSLSPDSKRIAFVSNTGK